jgi:long-subunit fatty acid transport protein
MRRRILTCVPILLIALQAIANGASIELYETGAPDLGTASAGRAAMAADASTAASNPAGLTLLDRNQFMVAAGAVLPMTNFDVGPEPQLAVAAAATLGCFFL